MPVFNPPDPIRYHSGEAYSYTGATGFSTPLVTVTPPVIGAGSVIMIRSIWSFTASNANVKQAHIYYGAAGGVQVARSVHTTELSCRLDAMITVNDDSVQQAYGNDANYGIRAADLTRLTQDLTAPVPILFYATLANAADMATLEGYLIEIFRQ